jgi:cytochrome c-type biogenesis protein CcmH
LTASPSDAPWVPLVREQLARLDGQQTIGAPAPDSEAIAGMVSGLASRLEAQGGSADEWARLIRSYAVLGQRDKATAAALKARQALAKDDAGLKTIDAMTRELQLTAATR